MVKGLGMGLALLVCFSCGQKEGQQSSESPGKPLYQKFCTSCHGDDGRKGLAGAADLSKTPLNRRQTLSTITQGQGNMPAFGGLLNQTELEQVLDYLEQLKTND